MAAQNLGSLFVTLDAKAAGFVKGMSEAMARVDKFSKEVKKLSNDVAQTAGALSALGAGAVAMAAQVDAKTAANVKRLTKEMQSLAIQVADVLAPAMRALGDLFRQAAQAIASLDPETRKQIAGWAVLAVQIGAGAKVLATVASLVGGVAGAFEALFAALAAIGAGPIAAIIAGVFAVVVAVAVLHKAWRENWGGIQQIAATVAQWFADTWNGVLAYVEGLFSDFVDGLAFTMKAGLEIMARVAEATGQKPAAAALRLAQNVVDSVAKDLKSGSMARRFIVAAAELGKAAATSLVEEFKIIAKELGLTEALDKILGVMKGKGTPRAAVPIGKAPADWYQEASDRANRIHGTMNRVGKLGGGLVNEGRKTAAEFNAMDAAAKAKAEEAAQATTSTLASIGEQFVSKLGKVGSIINDTINAARAGGPWAALAAALVGIATETQAFQVLLTTATSGLKVMTDAMEPAMRDLFGAVGQILAPLFQALANVFTAIGPVLNVVAGVVRRLAPIFVILGYFLNMLAPLIGLVAKLLEPVIVVVEVLARILFEVARVIMTVVGAIATGVVTIWNTILDVLAGIVDVAVGILTLGAVRDAGNFIRQGKGSTKAFDEGLQAMTLTSYDAAMASSQKAAADQAATEATEKATDAVQTFAESFLNVPSGYKVSSARFAATGESGRGYGGDGSMGDGTMIIIGTVQVDASNPVDFMKRMEALKRGETFKATGSNYGPPRNLR